MPAAVAVTRSHYQYVSDDGTVYRVRLTDYIATQLDTAAASIIGATLAVGNEPKFPGGHQLRRALMRDNTNKRDRMVVVATPSAPLITVPAPAGSGTLNLNHGTSSFAYTYTGQFLTETRGRRA